MSRVLPPEFYQQDTIEVARQLIGCRLIRQFPDGRILSGIIVETEAYLGVEDPACHSFGGRRTARTETMYRAGGCAYVYFIYGMYHCLNFVTEPSGVPEAVLIRALAPDSEAPTPPASMAGPGRLCRALGVDRSFDGVPLGGPLLTVQEPAEGLARFRIRAPPICETPRIGIASAGDAAFWPLRFSLAASPYISRPRP